MVRIDILRLDLQALRDRRPRRFLAWGLPVLLLLLIHDSLRFRFLTRLDRGAQKKRN